MALLAEQLESHVYDMARASYTDLPYHNFDHVLDTLRYFDSLYDRLKSVNVPINRSLGRVALLWHDAGYEDEFQLLGYDMQEEYHASLARTALENVGAHEDDIVEIEGSILATNPGVKPTTNLQKAVRYADVGNVYDRNFSEFVRNFTLITRESVVLGRSVAETFDAQKDKSLTFLQQYVSPVMFEASDGSMVELPPELNFAERNIRKLNQASLKTVLKIVPGSEKLLPSRWAA